MLSVLGVVGVTLVAAAIAASAQYVFKSHLKMFGFNMKEVMYIMTHPKTILGLSMYLVSLVIYLYALGNAPLISFVYPIFSSSFVFVLLISHFVFHERINLHRIAGVFLVMLGMAVIASTFTV